MTLLSRVTLFLGVKHLGGLQTALLGLGELIITIFFAHLWLGRHCAQKDEPPLLDDFCRFFVAFDPGRIVIAHLEELGRKADDYWDVYAALTEGLKKIGRNVSRKKLIGAIEQIDQFDSALMPLQSFGPNDHMGSTEVDIVSARALKHSDQ